MNPADYWTHKHDGYEVMVEQREELLTKAPGDATWHPAISYRRTDLEDSNDIYVRTAADFLAKFEPVMRDEADAA